MKILIKNGTVLTAESEYIADVLVDGERIAAIGMNLSDTGAERVIDAAGKYVIMN